MPPAATNNTYPISKWPYKVKETCITLNVNLCYDESCFHENGAVSQCSIIAQDPNALLTIKGLGKYDFPIVECYPPCLLKSGEDHTSYRKGGSSKVRSLRE
jgi:hypothetical protein